MKEIPLEGETLSKVLEGMKASEFFNHLSDKQMEQVALRGHCLQYEGGEIIIQKGSPATDFFLIITGEVSIVVEDGDDKFEVTRIGAHEVVGEMGLILDQNRGATVQTIAQTMVISFLREIFHRILTTIPECGVGLLKVFARRLQTTSAPKAHKDFREEADVPPVEILKLVPHPFMQRHRVAPLKITGNILILGYCDEMNESIKSSVARNVPTMKVQPVAMARGLFNKIMQSYVEIIESAESVTGVNEPAQINTLLERLVGEGASDLHLSAGHYPRWRIDGEIMEIQGFKKLEGEEIYRMIRPVFREDCIETFSKENDVDFAYSIDGLSRFRVNVFRDHRGVSAVFRVIPNNILTIKDLGLPETVRMLCDFPKGLVLVTGPTGSGKSTTLAAMINHINTTKKCHILTLEDPIEFVHQSKKALINQREVGVHTKSFTRALKAALREDPDIVLVGEMRDQETVTMALETANTGHLVFATLHTSTAASSIDRLIDMFPAGQQNQVRSVMADNLRGVVAQTLCKKISGGRIAALEILVADFAVANMIREGKTHQLINAMQTAKSKGNKLLNEELAALVNSRKIDPNEALSRAVDKNDLLRILEKSGTP